MPLTRPVGASVSRLATVPLPAQSNRTCGFPASNVVSYITHPALIRDHALRPRKAPRTPSRRVRRGLPRSSGERTSPRPRPGGRGAATGKPARSFPTPRHLPVSRPIGPRLPSLPHAARSGVPEHLAEVLDSRHSPRLFPPSFALPRPRPLRSAGVTRPLRYYKPLRHPAGPSWPSRVPGWRVHATGRASRVATASLLRACCRHYPGGNARCSRRSLPDRWLPSPRNGRVGFRICLFEACSTFTARCGLRAR